MEKIRKYSFIFMLFISFFISSQIIFSTESDQTISELKELLKNNGYKSSDVIVKKLDSMLLSKDNNVRRTAAYAINKMRNSEAAGLLIKHLNDEDAGVKIYSASVLMNFKKIKPEEAIEIFGEGLKDKNVEIRRLSAEVILFSDLYKEKNENILKALSEAVNDIDSKVKENVIMTLNNMQDKKTIPVLLIALKDNDPNIRNTALSGLARYLDEDNVLEQVILCVKDNDISVRSGAVIFLGMSKNKIVVEPLRSALKDENVIVRIGAAGALLRLGWTMDSEAGKVLKEASDSGDPQNKMLASMQISLASMAGANIDNDITKNNIDDNLLLLKSNDPFKRMNAISFFMMPAEKDERVTESLINALKDSDDGVRSNAVLAVAINHKADDRSIESLIPLLKDKNPGVRTNVCSAFLTIKNIRTVPYLIETLKDTEPQVRQNAQAALYTITNKDFGDDTIKWEEWWTKNNSAPAK